ncbi:MAG: hypothetical protein EB059_02510 [Alphaproteobacteria bacterium]|nr:hypothetical protein [Alphaproteobacteria bacterium]
MTYYSKKLLSIATLAITLISGTAFADTRADFINNPNAYGVITVSKGITNGSTVNFDIPIHASLLGSKNGAMPVSSNGRIYATSIGYYTSHPVVGMQPILGMAHSPYAH